MKVVKRRLADGSVKEYRYAEKATKTDRTAPGSIGALIQGYRRSPQFTGLRASTAKNYGHYLRDLEELADQPATAVTRGILKDMRDAIAHARGPGAANVFMRVTTTFFAWALDSQKVVHNPASRIKALPGGHLTAWTVEEADIAAKMLPASLARAVILARYTGQRRGDLIAMTWRAYDGATIRVHQQKTGESLVLPVHPALKDSLDEWKRSATSTHILTTNRGQPWPADYLTQEMNRLLPRIGLRASLNVHGLRKLAAASLAEAGCSMNEIAAITGHRTLAMVQLYTASADQERLAEAAIVRLKNHVRRPR